MADGGSEGKSANRATGMKSAYELALERMEKQGIERPEDLSDELRAAVAEARQQAEAKLAEIEILHNDRLKTMYSPDQRTEEQETYLLERRRIEAERDRKIDKLRAQRSG